MKPGTDQVLPELLALATRFSGSLAVPESRIYGDLDINGSDFIEFIEEVERRFTVDLSRVSPRTTGVPPQDASLSQIAAEVLGQQERS